MIRCTIMTKFILVAGFTIATCERTVGSNSKDVAQSTVNFADWNERSNGFSKHKTYLRILNLPPGQLSLQMPKLLSSIAHQALLVRTFLFVVNPILLLLSLLHP